MIIAITDRTISVTRDFLEQVERIANASPDMIILREKDLSEQEYRYLAIECMRICGIRNVRFCINSYFKIAKDLGADRIQLSFSSFKMNLEKIDDFKEKWVSIHSKKEAIEAEKLGATHLIYGNVFETSCKPGKEGKGLVALANVCKAVNIPVFGVGGIGPDNIKTVLETGCDGVCIRSLFMRAKDPSDLVTFIKDESV